MTSRVQAARADIERIQRRIGQTAEGIIVARKATLAGTAGRLNALSPLATLSRGYAVARDPKGKALTSTQDFRAGLGFELLLHDGKVGAEATKVSPK
jgi:exodeoxyribonuclease VII large subunit